jgi:outer membrane protein OmpA-like peptidoglycan-associated protein
MKKIVYLFFVVITSMATAQNVEFNKDNFKEDKKGLKEALDNIKAGDEIRLRGVQFYKLAIDPYLAAQKFNPNNAFLNFKIGECYMYSNYKIKAIPFFEKAYALDNIVDAQIHFLLGKVYHLDMQWDKAIAEYKIYGQTVNVVANADEKKIIDKRIAECVLGKEMEKNPVRVKKINIGGDVNSKYTDYAPVVSADESILMFTSRRPTGKSGDAIDPEIGEYFEDIYTSVQVNGKWGTATNMGSMVNTSDHDANSGISNDGQKLLIYIGKNNGDLYESELKGSAWSSPEHMNKNINTDFHESSAWYSPDVQTVYFVSDKPGGYGSRDIYMAQKTAKGKWGEAVNLGSVINTEYGEEGVFMHPDGKTLYFSSQGHETMGGYDIFKSVYNAESKSWSKPVNLGYPVNTADDDVFFVLSASGKHGYYSSFSTTGFGEKDIFMISFLGPPKEMVLDNEDNLLANNAAPVKENNIAPAIAIADAQLTILKGVITDAKTQKPIEATIEIIDIQKNIVIATFNSNSATGKYLITLPAGKNYGIVVKQVGYLFHSENIDIPVTAAYQEITKDIALNSLEVGSKIVLKNVFFDVNKATLRPESVNELDRLTALMNEIPTLKIELSGHTDSRGSSESNQSLSDRRSKAVVDYLLSKGIMANRLTHKGYGEDQPMAPNDTEANMQLNRRTEVKITAK